jgi:hypothetical protein
LDLSVDWKKIRTWVVMGIVGLTGTILLSIWGAYGSFVALEGRVHSHIATAEVDRNHTQKTLEKILVAIESVSARQEQQLTLVGRGKKGNFGGGESYVQINANSRAHIYLSHPKINITNLTSMDKPRHSFKIHGTYSGSDPDTLVRFSRMAADILEVENQVQIRLEPYN